MANATVGAGLPKAFLDFAVLRGGDRQMLIERSNIPPDSLQNQDNRIPLTAYVALLKAGIDLCGEPALALLFGEAVKMQDVSILGLLGEVSETESGPQLLNRYAPLLIDDGEEALSDLVEFTMDHGKCWMKFTSPVYVNHPLLTESGFARCVCTARAMFESNGIVLKNSFPHAIHFTHDEPSYRGEYERIFGVPLVFGSQMNALLLDQEHLSISSSRTNPYLSEILTARAEELLKRLESSKSTRGRVEGLLTRILHTGEANVETIASRLGVSRHTLFRKLKAEGVTFERVLDELRHELAVEYLREKKTSVNATAYLLGFSDAATFSRAFKRWTGSRPSEISKSGTWNEKRVAIKVVSRHSE